jgi:Family of unknown function (DUF5989)
MTDDRDDSTGSAGGAGREFDRMASGKSGNLFGEVWAFLRDNKKWWLLPLIVVLVLVGALIVLSTTAVAPFIYTLF